MRLAALGCGAVLAVVAGCGGARPSAPPVGGSAARIDEARQLIEQGQFDQALSRLQGISSDAESLYLQGVAWVKKAESAPLPTPPPPPSPLPRDYERPPAPEFKGEEIQAIQSFEGAIALKADHAGAQGDLAALLAPHAVRRHEVEAARRVTRAVRRGKAPRPEPSGETGPDHSTERVMRSYRAALQADSGSVALAEALVRFAEKVEDADGAELGYQELTKRVKESAEPFVRYGDFLARERKNAEAAIVQYRQALIWRPDDAETRARIAEIYLAMGLEGFAKKQYAVAAVRFEEAKKYVTPDTPQAQRVSEHLARLAAIRGRH